MYQRVTLALARLFTLSRDDLKREDGQAVTEYAIVLGIVMVALVAVAALFAGGIQTVVTNAVNKLQTLIP
jgi:Flp pilus assembly pilin Flp